MIQSHQIRERLVHEIQTSPFTQKELAEQTGVIQQSIAQYISGRAMLSFETFANLCAVLNADPAYILCLKDD